MEGNWGANPGHRLMIVRDTNVGDESVGTQSPTMFPILLFFFIRARLNSFYDFCSEGFWDFISKKKLRVLAVFWGDITFYFLSGVYLPKQGVSLP